MTADVQYLRETDEHGVERYAGSVSTMALTGPASAPTLLTPAPTTPSVTTDAPCLDAVIDCLPADQVLGRRLTAQQAARVNLGADLSGLWTVDGYTVRGTAIDARAHILGTHDVTLLDDGYRMLEHTPDGDVEHEFTFSAFGACAVSVDEDSIALWSDAQGLLEDTGDDECAERLAAYRDGGNIDVGETCSLLLDVADDEHDDAVAEDDDVRRERVLAFDAAIDHLLASTLDDTGAPTPATTSLRGNLTDPRLVQRLEDLIAGELPVQPGEPWPMR